MSTLEKTINLLNALPENQIEIIYNFAQFLNRKHRKTQQDAEAESIDSVLGHIVGMVPDTGKFIADYKEERLRERYVL